MALGPKAQTFKLEWNGNLNGNGHSNILTVRTKQTDAHFAALIAHPVKTSFL